MIIEKIDPAIINNVTKQSLDNLHSCVIYTNNITKTIDRLKRKNNDIDLYKLDFINAICVALDYNAIVEISHENDVTYISNNSKVFALGGVSKRVHGIPESDKIISDKSSDFSCCVIDTGVYPHLDLQLGRSRIIKFVDLVNGKNNIYDDNGHGTFVVGLLSKKCIIDLTMSSGIDNYCNIIVIKALNNDGEGSALDILKAMQWVYDNRKNYNIKLVCMSFGSNITSKRDPLIMGAEILWNNGITVVCAAGNSGPEKGTIKSPAGSGKIITVGALDDHRDANGNFDVSKFSVADFSSRGPVNNFYKPDVLACGVSVIGCSNFGITNKFYEKMSGTSVATPIVAGICSLIIRKFPNLKPNDIKKLLITHCNKITGDRNAEGFGWINVEDIFKRE